MSSRSATELGLTGATTPPRLAHEPSLTERSAPQARLLAALALAMSLIACSSAPTPPASVVTIRDPAAQSTTVEATAPPESRCSGVATPTPREPALYLSVNGQPTLPVPTERGAILVQIQCGRDINAILAKYQLKGPATRHVDVPVTQEYVDIGMTRWFRIGVVEGTEGETVVTLFAHPEDIAYVQLIPDPPVLGIAGPAASPAAGCLHAPAPLPEPSHQPVNGHGTWPFPTEPGVIVVQIQCGREINAVLAKYQLLGPARRWIDVPDTQEYRDNGATRWYVVLVPVGTEGATVVALYAHPEDIAYVQLLERGNSSGLPGSNLPASTVLPPFVGARSGDTGVRTNATGTLVGNWTFIGRWVPRPGNTVFDVQIWAVPLDGGAPKAVLAYDAPAGGVPEAINDNAPYLRRQFSPDGTKLVLSVSGQLVVVDLPSGDARRLAAAGYYPSWSKDGSQIAYLADKPVEGRGTPDHVLSIVPSAGGSSHDVLNLGDGRGSAEWSPDGRQLVVAESNAITILDVSTAAVVRRIAPAGGVGPSFAHWRTAAPQLALIATGCTPPSTRVLVVDEQRGERVARDTGEGCNTISVSDPRWNPVLGTQLLYVVGRFAGGTGFAAHVLDLATGTDVALPLNASEATWTWDGQQIVYLHKSVDGRPFGDALHIASRYGTNDRELIRGQGSVFFSLASLAY